MYGMYGYGYGYGFDPTIILVLIGVALSLWAQGRVNSTSALFPSSSPQESISISSPNTSLPSGNSHLITADTVFSRGTTVNSQRSKKRPTGSSPDTGSAAHSSVRYWQKVIAR